MKKLARFCLLSARMLMAVLVVSLFACTESDPAPVPSGVTELPADAGRISMTPQEDGSVLLVTSEIFRAETYRWYKDGQQVQHSDARSYMATESGMYKVAGVNGAGEGRPSDEVEVLVGQPIELPGFEISVNEEALTAWSVLFDIRPEDPDASYYYDIISKNRWEQTDLKSLQAEIEEAIRGLAEMTDVPYEEALAGMLQQGDLLNCYNGSGFRGEEEYYIYAFYWDADGASSEVTLCPFRTPAPETSSETFTISFEEVTPYSMQVVCDPSLGVVDYYLYFDETAQVDSMFAALEDENAYLSYHAMNVGLHFSDFQSVQRQGLKPETSYTALAMVIDELGNRFLSRAEQTTPSVNQIERVESVLFEELLGEWHGRQTISDVYSGAYTTEFTVTIVQQVEQLDHDFRAKNQLVALVDGWNQLTYYGIAALEKEYEGLEDVKNDPAEAYGPKWLIEVAEGDRMTIDGRARHSVIGWMFMGDCFLTSADANSMVVYTTEDLPVTLSEDRNVLTISSPASMPGCYPSLAYYFDGFGWMAHFYGGSEIVLTRK